MRHTLKIDIMSTVKFNEIHEVEPTENGWSVGERVEITDIEYDYEGTHLIGYYMDPIFDVSFDLIENRYYRIKNKYDEEHFYQFKDGELNPISWSDINIDNSELRKENARLKAELDHIYEKLKIKK